MDNKDEDLKSALDDIFGDDFIEIDTDSKEDEKQDDMSFVISESFENNTYSDKDEVLYNDALKDNKIDMVPVLEEERKNVEESPIVKENEEVVPAFKVEKTEIIKKGITKRLYLLFYP